MPVVWVRTCHGVIGAHASLTRAGGPPLIPCSSVIVPASTSCSTPMAVIDFVIDASWQTASVPIRRPPGSPNASSRTTPSAPATPRIANGTAPASTCVWAMSKAGWSARRRAESVGGMAGIVRRWPYAIGLSLLSRFSGDHALPLREEPPRDPRRHALEPGPPGAPIAEEIGLRLADAWGEMGAAWGVAPAIARVHAYLMTRGSR